MRDIKFRAWHKVKEKMEYELYIASVNGGILDKNLNDNTIAYILMQYTGLKDKNGKEIYEGDIVGNGKIKGEVYYSTEDAAFMVRGDKNSPLPYMINSYACEAIGNIYENPDAQQSSEELKGTTRGEKHERM